MRIVAAVVNPKLSQKVCLATEKLMANSFRELAIVLEEIVIPKIGLPLQCFVRPGAIVVFMANSNSFVESEVLSRAE